MNFNDVLKEARTCIGNYCKACPVCNGMACRNQMPGPGAKGVGDGAIRNYQKWQEIRVNMDTLCENAPVDASLEIFGKKNAPARVTNPEALGLRHLAFYVEDVEAAAKELNANGIETEPIRIDPLSGQKCTFFRDPDDLPLELYGG